MKSSTTALMRNTRYADSMTNDHFVSNSKNVSNPSTVQGVRQADSQRHPVEDAHDGARGAPVQVPVLREDVEDGSEPGVPREGAQGGEAIPVSYPEAS